MRYKNQGKSGDAAPEKKKKYVYADALTFLLSSMEKRPTSGNIPECNEGTDGNLQEEQNGDTTVNSEIIDEAVGDTPLQPPKPTTKGQINRKNKMSPFQCQLLAKLSSSSAADEDPDRHYILSLLSDFKTLNEDEKLDFKLMNIQFFKNVRRRKTQQTAPPGPYQHQPLQLQPNYQSWNQPNSSMQGPSQQRVNQFIPSDESSYSSAVSPSESVYSYNFDG